MQNSLTDEITLLQGSTIQHGKLSDRIYVMDYAAADIPSFVESLQKLATQRGYTKIFIKAPISTKDSFIEAGFCKEAEVPRFYANEAGGFFSKFLQPERAINKDEAITTDILQQALTKAISNSKQATTNFKLKCLDSKDAPEIASLYRQVFDTYPFPIYDKNYIKDTMAESVVYFGAWEGKKLVAVCSAEINPKYAHAEMTDFATLPEYRGKGLASNLLMLAQDEMKKRKIRLLYTIARALSLGMNITFARSGYSYAGTLINNTNISGGIETMNVWYRSLYY